MKHITKKLSALFLLLLAVAHSPALTLALKPDKNPDSLADERSRLEEFCLHTPRRNSVTGYEITTHCDF